MKHTNHIFTLVLFLFFVTNLKAQTKIKTYERSLNTIFKQIIAEKNDEAKEKKAFEIKEILQKTLELDSSFIYPFDSLQFLGKLTSADMLMRIYTWNIPLADGTYKYYGYVQLVDKNKKNKQIIFLNDKSAQIENPEQKTLDASNWFGALYYAIVQNKSNGNTYYTLCGWDGNTLLTNRKLIDVLTITPSGTVQFGSPILQSENGLKKRVIFEYSKNTQMMLVYDVKKKMLVFDHLSPSSPSFKNQFQYYGPDFSYDAYSFEKDKWIFKSNVILQNEELKPPKNRKVNKYNNKKP